MHGEGKILRFWNLPQDAPHVWAPLWEADVDLINTDDLAGLATFITEQTTEASAKTIGAPAATGEAPE